jgi:hypothetical protein
MTRRFFSKLLLVVVAVFGLLVLSSMLSAQGRSQDAFERVKEVQEKHTDRLMAIEGVEGTAVGVDDSDRPAVKVFLENPGVRGIPRELDGVPVHPVVTGKFYALPKPSVPPGQGKKPPKDTTPPAGPSDLTATAVTSSQINLSWMDNANNEKGFNIERKITDSFAQIATVGANKTSYSDTGLAPLMTCTYRVRAYNDAGKSGYSNEASATTLARVYPPLWCERPVPIGVSTGNAGECSAGTIGCRVKDSLGNVYALSNNHVYALENKAPRGSIILQPGTYDSVPQCAVYPEDKIGTLSAYKPIVFSRRGSNTIDAAIAQILSGNDGKPLVGIATPLDGYGTPSNTIKTLTKDDVGLAVQKYGRTTSLTKGTITGINAIVNVGYSSGTARFVDQIIVQSSTAFIGAGDSGSLLVTDSGRNPVGLLFAGDQTGTYAVANRIDLVLGAFDVTVDGDSNP